MDVFCVSRATNTTKKNYGHPLFRADGRSRRAATENGPGSTARCARIGYGVSSRNANGFYWCGLDGPEASGCRWG